MKKEKRINILCSLLFLAYLMITFIVVLYHEPWMDEAQSWLIARHFDVAGIFNYMEYEGHSCLWHLILKVFIELKFSYAIVNFIPWVITSIATIIFYIYADLKKTTKIILLYTPISIYFSIFARPYALFYSLMLFLMMAYKKREQHPFIYGVLLALIANTHVLTLGFVGSLILIDLYEIIKEKSAARKEKTISILLASLGILLFFIQVIGATTVRKRFFIDITKRFLINFIYLFLELFKGLGYYSIFSAFLLVLFFIILIQLFKNKKMFFVAFCSILFQITFLSLFYFYIGDYHATISFLILVFCLLMSTQNKSPSALYFLLCILVLPHSFHLISYDIKNDYSDCKEIVAYLKQNGTKGEIILHGTNYVTIFPYFKEEDFVMYSLNSDKRLYLNDFGEKEVALNDEEKIYEELKRLNADYFIYYQSYSGSEDEVKKMEFTNEKLEFIQGNQKVKLYRYKK